MPLMETLLGADPGGSGQPGQPVPAGSNVGGRAVNAAGAGANASAHIGFGDRLAGGTIDLDILEPPPPVPGQGASRST
jgi:hypothetical protein